MASDREYPAHVSDETLRSFEADLPATEGEPPVATEQGERRTGVLLLAGMALLIAVGVATALSWFV